MKTSLDIQSSVAKLVGKRPKSATWKQEGAYSTTTMTNAAATSTSVTISPPIGFDPKMVDGDTIEDSDVMVLLPSLNLTITPKTGDQVVIDSTNYRVQTITAFDVGDLVVGWEVQLRK